MDQAALRAAIIDKQPAAVVEGLAGLDEARRGELAPDFLVFITACHAHASRSFQVPEALRTPVQVLVDEFRHEGLDADTQLLNAAGLASYAVLSPHDSGHRWGSSPAVMEPEFAARVFLDRRADWMESQVNQWLTESNQNGMLPFWFYLVAGGWTCWPGDYPVASAFAMQLSETYKKHRDAVQQAMRTEPRIAACLNQWISHEMPANDRGFRCFAERNWKPVYAWAAKEKLFDRDGCAERLLEMAQPDPQREAWADKEYATGAVLLEAIKPTAMELWPHLALIQPLFRHRDSSAVAAAVEFVKTLLMDRRDPKKIGKGRSSAFDDMLDELHLAMGITSKATPNKVLKLLPLIVERSGGLDNAVRLATSALHHPNADVQATAAEWIAENKGQLDSKQLESIDSAMTNVAPTTRRLLQSLPASSDARNPSDAPEVKESSGIRDDKLQTPDKTVPPPKTIDRIDDIGTLAKHLEQTKKAIEDADLIDALIDAMFRLPREGKAYDKAAPRIAKLYDVNPDTSPIRWTGVIRSFPALVLAWAGKPFDRELHRPRNLLDHRVLELADRLAESRPTMLLSTPTHHGGRIDPSVWGRRLGSLGEDLSSVMPRDLELSILRLMESDRDEALGRLDDALPQPIRSIARRALGAVTTDQTDIIEHATDEAWHGAWIAAMRTAEPDAVLPIKGTPLENVFGYDTHLPTQYAFTMQPGTPTPYQSEMQITPGSLPRPVTPSTEDNVLDEIKSAMDLDRKLDSMEPEAAGLIESMLRGAINKREPTPMWITDLHGLVVSANETNEPPQMMDVGYRYLATFWPDRHDWFDALACIGLSRRVNSGRATFDNPGGYLDVICSADRAIDPMAARALWVGSASKDPNVVAAATRAWTAILDRGDPTEEDRSQWISALAEVNAHGWIVYKRTAKVLTAAAEDTAVRRERMMKLLEDLLTTMDWPPRDAALFLAPLQQWYLIDHRDLTEPMRRLLATYKSGKAKTLAKAILAADGTPPVA